MNGFGTSWKRMLVGGACCVLLTAGVFVLAAAGGSDVMVYLPAVWGVTSSTGGGTLVNGGTVEGPDGVAVGALADTLQAPVEVTIARTEAPAPPLPSEAQAVGDYYAMNGPQDVFVGTESPFTVAFPVPSGADTEHLALAVLGSAEAPTDMSGDVEAWTLLEGFYEADANRFLTTIAGLTGEERVFVLATHPDFDSPPNLAAASSPQEGSPDIDLFHVKCIYFVNPTLCTPSMESEVADLLTDAYQRFVNELGFMEPRLRYLHETLDFDASRLSSLGYTVYIEPSYLGYCDEAQAGGYYDQLEGRLVLCLDPTVGLTTSYYYVVIHEYFHATEFAYPQVLVDDLLLEAEPWIIEGMAKSAEESYRLDEMWRSTIGGWEQLHKVDAPLNSQAGLDGYFAQDFWVFYGQQQGKDLSYLIDVLTAGAKTEDVVNVLGDGETLPAYWEWAKNQVMEKQIDFDGALQSPCNLQGDVVQQVDVFPHTWPTYLYHDVTVGPLTTLVVEIDFSHAYDMGYGWVFATDPAQEPFATQALGYKFYKDGQGGCESVPDGARTFEEAEGGIDKDATYYVVISNTDYDDTYLYTITFELPIPD